MDQYIHNSNHKDFIRQRWLDYVKDKTDPENGLSIITLPAQEMSDLCLFRDNGLIEWEENETNNLTIKKGKIICFEKSTRIYLELRERLVNAEVLNQEIGSFFRQKYESIMKGSPKYFPVDVINLDYDGNLSRNKVAIDEKIDLIFKFQANHQKDFSLFITWPSTETEDDDNYKQLLRQTILNNLSDVSALAFKELFESKFNGVENLDYDQLSIIGLSKVILRKASVNFYQLNRNEMYVYGEKDRRRMYSILYQFDYKGNSKAENLIYSEDVDKSLNEIVNLSVKSNEVQRKS